MILKYLLSAFIVIIAASSSSAKTPTAILDETAKKIASTPSVEVKYTVTAHNKSSDGTLTLQGEKFHLSSPDMAVWYDGNTQWTYSSATNEVNITEPTPEELAQINPLIIINSFKKLYNTKSLKAPAGYHSIELTPKNPKGIQIKKVVLTVNSSSYYPHSIVLTMDNGTKLTIKIKTIKGGINHSKGTFVFNKKNFPKAEIVDLR